MGPFLNHLKSTEVGEKEGAKEWEQEWQQKSDQVGKKLHAE